MAYWVPKIASMYQTVFSKNRFIGLCVLLVCSCTPKPTPKVGLPYYNTPDFTPIFSISKDSLQQLVPHTIGDFAFTDQHGAIITQKNIEDKIHVANFIFTSCGSICPVMTSHLKLLQSTFEKDSNVVVLSYSVTPWIDSVPRLQQYAVTNDIHSNNWHLLTGSKSSIYALARTAYFAEEDLGFTKDSTQFLHTEHIILVDKTKRIRGVYNGTLLLEAEQLVKDIKVLLVE
jgi:protein SCO1/2